MFIWLNQHKKTIVLVFLQTFLVLISVAFIFFSLKPIVVTRLRNEPKQLIIDFLKDPLLNSKKIQISIDPYTPFTINKLSFIQYQLILSKDSMNRINDSYNILFTNQDSGKIYTTYKINDVINKYLATLNKEQITANSNTFKTAAQTQYPFFELFPYSTVNLKVQYNKPLTLTLYLKKLDTDTQTRGLLDLSIYLEQNNLSFQTLINKGVQVEYKELPQDYSGPSISE